MSDERLTPQEIEELLRELTGIAHRLTLQPLDVFDAVQFDLRRAAALGCADLQLVLPGQRRFGGG